MSSSDSEDCYGNIAQKLQSLKNQYVEEKIPSVDLVDFENSDLKSTAEINTGTIDVEEFNTTLNSTDNEEWTLDAIIAKNTTAKRGRKRKTAVSSETIVPSKTRRKTANSNKQTDSTVVTNEDTADIDDSGPVTGRRGRNSRLRNNSSAVPNTSPRGRRGSSRRSTTNRGRGGGRNRRNNSSRVSASVTTYPTYSIGNTDDYPDECGNQELFSTNPAKSNEVEIVDDEDPLANDNEEMSVKVYWQSLEVVRFKIRKYQKLKPIFKYFSERENVVLDKLLFMYNDRIVKIDDTPDAIDYSIAKFIDGGIVERNVTGLIKETSEELQDGLRIKFQCQHLKKPFETTIRPDDTFGLAMMKCAEHLETPLNRLKFFFDGDLISSKTTAEELDLEGGECIDVKIGS
ncbi:unnamed protein product [Arctia plantaginis]|uniref:Ubiquitin-like domain-containing protein n=1 Tax=Arctia plantaginis TaxID=874455 RepID=A0A8S0ZWJ3_ARCPL|nr:unnamed protein product [Arctia plantaginis]